MKYKEDLVLDFKENENKEIHFHNVLLELKRLDNTNLNLFLKKVLVVTSGYLNIERVSIWFFDKTASSLTCYYLYCRSENTFKYEPPIQIKDYPVYFRTISGSNILSADDVLSDRRTKELEHSYLVPKQITSMTDIPIRFNGRIIGILCNESTEKKKWTEEDKKFISAVSAMISSAIEIDLNNQYNKDNNESERFLTTLISNLPGYVYRVRKEPDKWTFQYLSDGIFDLTGYHAQELIESDHLYYGLMVDENDKNLAKIAVNEALNSNNPYEITYRIKSKNGSIKWVWERGQGVLDENGMLIATEGFITEITERKNTEEELIKRNNELSMINLIGQSLSKLTESDKLISEICVMLGKLFNIDNLYIALYDENKNIISFPYYAIEGAQITVPARPFGNGITEFVIKTRKSLLINSGKLETLKVLGIKPQGRDSLSLLATPMIAGEAIIGVITLQDYEHENVFTHSQLETLSVIASQAAIAIENSRLYSSLKKSLNEKEILLQEVHHRVKNNLQIMSSLIKLQSHYINDEQLLQILKETENRIQSMAIVHSKLYATQEYENIDFAEYVKNLTDNFWNTFGIKLKNLQFDIKIENISLNIDTAIPCGLIINELVANSIKYAYPDNRKGVISISLEREKKSRFYKLIVQDDGIGMAKSLNVEKADTLGIQLVNMLAKQMNGKLEVISGKNTGSKFIIILEEALYKARK